MLSDRLFFVLKASLLVSDMTSSFADLTASFTASMMEWLFRSLDLGVLDLDSDYFSQTAAKICWTMSLSSLFSLYIASIFRSKLLVTLLCSESGLSFLDLIELWSVSVG